LKKIYQAANVIEAEGALDEFSQKWDEKYSTGGEGRLRMFHRM
jgi:transposase-like protein